MKFADWQPEAALGGLNPDMGFVDLGNPDDLSGAQGGVVPIRSAGLGFAREFIGQNHILIARVFVRLTPGCRCEKGERECSGCEAGPAGQMAELTDAKVQKSNDPDGGGEDDPLVRAEIEETISGDSEIALSFADFAHEIARFLIEWIEKEGGMAGGAGAGGIVGEEVGLGKVEVEG